MVGIFLTILITLLVSAVWVVMIDREIQYQQKNPDYKPEEGWLDWDEAHTEGEL